MINNVETKGDLQLIAGPCSLTPNNQEDIWKLADMRVKNLKGVSQLALCGVRTVGLKSRTGMNSSGRGMGIDFDTHRENERILENGGSINDLIVPPTAQIASDIIAQTGAMVGTEVMDPKIQMPIFERIIPNGKLLAWSPSVQQLGWPVAAMARAASRHNWLLGIKNGKWLDGEIDLEQANHPATNLTTDLGKTWAGLASYALSEGVKNNNLVLIHRGVCVLGKKDYRSAPIHEVARRAKHAQKEKVQLWFDPSHSLGPKMRDQIVDKTIEAMHMKDGNNWLYDGALIEVGNAPTDTNQHISINEMQVLAQELAKFRSLKALRN